MRYGTIGYFPLLWASPMPWKRSACLWPKLIEIIGYLRAKRCEDEIERERQSDIGVRWSWISSPGYFSRDTRQHGYSRLKGKKMSLKSCEIRHIPTLRIANNGFWTTCPFASTARFSCLRHTCLDLWWAPERSSTIRVTNANSQRVFY